MGLRTHRLHWRPVAGLAALFGLALMLAPSPGAAQGTPEQRAACEGDAMRLCGDFVPDAQRITACMAQKRRLLSPRCRAVFDGGARKKTRRAGN
jgi:type II secretory pathway component PulL